MKRINHTIQCERKLVRVNSNFNECIQTLPKAEQEKVLIMFNNPPVKVNTTLDDGELVYPGITVIHTPVHICLYHEGTKTIIAGDAMNIVDGEFVGPKTHNLTEDDAKIAINSLKKFQKFDVENIICYHGGLFNNNTNQKIKELTSLE